MPGKSRELGNHVPGNMVPGNKTKKYIRNVGKLEGNFNTEIKIYKLQAS